MWCRLCAFELERAPQVPELLSKLRARRGLVALDSAPRAPATSANDGSRAWSLIGFDPLRTSEASGSSGLPADLAGLRAFAHGLEVENGGEVPGLFRGGFIGASSYDLGVDGERHRLRPDPWRSPRIIGGLYTDFIVRDELGGRAWLVLGDGALDGRARVAVRREEILALLDAPEPDAERPHPLGPLVRWTTPDLHRARIERLREHIAAGDLYQANLAHRFTRAIAGDPVDIYMRLRSVNPAPFSAFFAWDESTAPDAPLFPCGAILSTSPELLLDFDGTTARTRPIKGTAPRALDPRVDRRNADDLLASAKDRAELAMIVDLERNDLGRFAQPGSVRVERFPHLESYAGVHHLTADVVAEVKSGIDAFDLLATLFPGGSITGAPKLAAMDAIAALEGEGRGFFSGSLGFVDTRGHACWNILIRTLVWRPDPRAGKNAGEVSFHVGGGITWSSDAAAEDEETLHKGAHMALALEAEPVRSGRS